MPEPRPVFDPCDEVQRNERLHHFSHALKNRLGSLWQAVTMLHDLGEGPERKQLLELAERNYFNGAGELERLMDDFEVPRGVSALQRGDVDLQALLEQCIGNIAFRTVKKEQEVRFRPAGRTVVSGDREVLRQLVEALLSNASKFSPKGGLIEVDVVPETGHVCIAVKDQGVGLSEADLQQVFQRYALLGSRSTDGESQARSTLARAKQWAELHGGSLEAASEGCGKGSTFRVRLPAA